MQSDLARVSCFRTAFTVSLSVNRCLVGRKSTLSTASYLRQHGNAQTDFFYLRVGYGLQ